MRLINNSSFRTEDLRVFITAGCQHMGVPTRGLVVECGDGWVRKWRPSLGRYGTRARPARWMRIIVKHHLAGPDPGAESGFSPAERFARMHAGRPIEGDVPPDSELARGMAHVIEHECLHLLGVRHSQMTRAQHYFSAAEEAGRTYAWAAGLGIRRTPVPETVAPVVRLERARLARTQKSERTEARVRALYGRWTAELARAERQVRKLRTKLRYYDRRRAAAGGQPS